GVGGGGGRSRSPPPRRGGRAPRRACAPYPSIQSTLKQRPCQSRLRPPRLYPQGRRGLGWGRARPPALRIQDSSERRSRPVLVRKSTCDISALIFFECSRRRATALR